MEFTRATRSPAAEPAPEDIDVRTPPQVPRLTPGSVVTRIAPVLMLVAMAGMLVPINGLAPTPALVTTQASAQSDEPAAVVRSLAPTDSLLGDGAWFDGPTGVVRDPAGRVVLVGTWTALDAAGPQTDGMRPLPDPTTEGETYGC